MARLRAGAVQKDITPQPGATLSGYIRRNGDSAGIHDSLIASFLALDNGQDRLLIIALDILFAGRPFVQKAKNAISQETGTQKSKICLACIHTQSAPGLHFFRNGGKEDKAWEESVLDTLVKGAKESFQKLCKASLGAGTGMAHIGKNRRKEGGPVDPNLTLIYLKDENDNPIAAITSCGCHP